MKYKIVLFQPYLRKHILNFGKFLQKFEFVVKCPNSGNFYKTQLPNFEKEILREKTTWQSKLRRLIGLLNVRVKFDKNADLFFTYGCLLFTNKPYCVYIENGVALYNYDTQIAKHPIARCIFSFLVRRKNCKKLLFMSEAGQKSFLATVPYSQKTREVILKKSVQIYPLIEEKKNMVPKQFSENLKLLYVGMVYIKGGIELAHSFDRIRQQYNSVSLTIITPLHTVKESDLEIIQNIPGVTLLDATLNESQMSKIYASHDIFVLPTFRDGFGLVLVEAISWGMPIIGTDQYATSEVGIDGYNAMMYPNHPLKDYDPKTFTLLGKYYNPKDFYHDLFELQKNGQLRPIEDFLFRSIERFVLEPTILEKYSKNSLDLYNKKFHQDIISRKIESVFLESMH